MQIDELMVFTAIILLSATTFAADRHVDTDDSKEHVDCLELHAYANDVHGADRVADKLDLGVPVDCRDPSNGSTALMDASESGSTDVVRVLIEHGADVNAHDKHGETAISKAITIKDQEEVAGIHPEYLKRLSSTIDLLHANHAKLPDPTVKKTYYKTICTFHDPEKARMLGVVVNETTYTNVCENGKPCKCEM